MKIVRLLALLFLVVGCADQALAQRAVIVVRHAERASDTDDKSALSEAGAARAKALARHLRDAGIRAILTSDTRRALDTAAPIAAALGLEPVAFPVASPDALNAAIVAAIEKNHGGEVVLVIGHSDTIPGLLRALGAPAEVTIPREEFDNLWMVVPGSKAGAVVLRLRY